MLECVIDCMLVTSANVGTSSCLGECGKKRVGALQPLHDKV